MVDHTERMVTLRDGKFQVQLLEGGSGESLLYLHGIGGFPGWPPFLDRLAEHYHVYVPAQPGVAGSIALEHLDDLWDLVLFYDELMQELGLDKSYLLGHCYGGMVAAELAAHRPERVTGLALVCPLGLWLDETPVADLFALTPSEQGRLLWYDPESESARAYLVEPDDPTAKMEAQLDRTQTLAAVGKFIWPIPDRGLANRAHRITMPTLLLWGDSDGVVPSAYGQAFERLLPNTTLQIIDRCGHLPQLERPDQFIDAVRRFLVDH